MGSKMAYPFMGKESKMEEKKEKGKMPKYARGGGIEVKGKTKGKMY